MNENDIFGAAGQQEPLYWRADNSMVNVQRFLRANPVLTRYPDIRQTFEIYNPGHPDTNIVIRGLYQRDIDKYRQGSFFKGIIDIPKRSTILVNWPSHHFNLPYMAAQLEDLYQTQNIKTIKLLGSSYGGYVALEVLSDMKKHSSPVKPTGLITIMSSVSAETLSIMRKYTRSVVAPLTMTVNRFKEKYLGSLNEKTSIRQSELERLRAIRTKQLTKEDLPSDIPVLSFITSGQPLFGKNLPWLPNTPDFRVNSRSAANKLSGMFDHIEIVEVEGSAFILRKKDSLIPRINGIGAHRITHESWKLIQDKIIAFLSA